MKSNTHHRPLSQRTKSLSLFVIYALSLSLLPAFARPLPRSPETDLPPAASSEGLFKESSSPSPAQTGKPAHLCILSPTVKQGSLSGEAFVDRLLGQLKLNEQVVKAGVLENVSDPNQLSMAAAKEGCQLLLFLTIAGDSPKIRMPFGARYKLEVQYRVADVASNDKLPDETLSEKGKDPEAILRSVLAKIVATILNKAAAITASPQATATTPPPDNSSPARASSNLFNSTTHPRLVVQTSHTAMLWTSKTARMEGC